jgi:hypothetical protein
VELTGASRVMAFFGSTRASTCDFTLALLKTLKHRTYNTRYYTTTLKNLSLIASGGGVDIAF